jgi:hypothetical protein
MSDEKLLGMEDLCGFKDKFGTVFYPEYQLQWVFDQRDRLLAEKDRRIAELEAECAATVADADAVCGSYAKENQQFSDRIAELEEALRFYADGEHFIRADPDAWDTVSGEPPSLWEDEANTATVEDGTVARFALESVAPKKGEQP